MFAGRAPGYAGVDTVYHDRQHTLDVTLTMARLLAGHERQADALWQFGGERAVAGIVMALFHDVGYLRRDSDAAQMNGAEFTRTHVSRGVEFLNYYLPAIGMPQWAPIVGHRVCTSRAMKGRSPIPSRGSRATGGWGTCSAPPT